MYESIDFSLFKRYNREWYQSMLEKLFLLAALTAPGYYLGQIQTTWLIVLSSFAPDFL